MFNRRKFIRYSLAGATSAAAGNLLPGKLRAGLFDSDPYADLPPLRDVAKKAGIHYGAAILPDRFDLSEAYEAATARECSLIVPENDLKWSATHPEKDRWDCSKADRLFAFADAHDIKMRGTTLVWHNAFPQWALDTLTPKNAKAMMKDHIFGIMRRYAGRITAWDVVNEAIRLEDHEQNGLRTTPFLKALGPSYIETAFHLAREADPKAKRIYNDFGGEWVGKKSSSILELVQRLLDKGAPVDGVGLQAHIGAQPNSFDPHTLRRFCREVKRMGLELQITELDVSDLKFQALDEDKRDAMIAERTRAYLDVVFSEIRPTQILTWGISDQSTWLKTYFKNSGDIRPLPLDMDCKRKPMWKALYDTFVQAAV